MVTNKQARDRIREYITRHKITVHDDRADLPVRVINPSLIPINGSAHTASGRIVSRKMGDKLFRKAKFA